MSDIPASLEETDTCTDMQTLFVVTFVSIQLRLAFNFSHFQVITCPVQKKSCTGKEPYTRKQKYMVTR